jgi:L-lactate dehydrogenase complex protein LldG
MDIDLPTMLLRVRGGGIKLDQVKNMSRRPQGIPRPVHFGLRLFTWFASDPRRFTFAQKMAAVFSRIWSPKAEWMVIPAFTGWGFSKDFPRPAAKTFRDRWVNNHSMTGDKRASSVSAGSVDSRKVDLPDPPVPQSSIHQTPEQLISQFREELETLGGKFVHCVEPELPARILALLGEWDVHTVMTWEDPHLPEGLVDALREQGIDVQHKPDPEIRVGITGSTAGIAETGTLVVTSGKGKHQSTSLLPEIHIAILHAADLQKNLEKALSLPKVRDAAAVSLISGPSKTADIEMTLTIGVHGPGEVIVFLI